MGVLDRDRWACELSSERSPVARPGRHAISTAVEDSPKANAKMDARDPIDAADKTARQSGPLTQMLVGIPVVLLLVGDL